MLNFCRKAKGSISIFLCLILLPMVTYSTMIIDATRMQSARVNLQCAGDLALNAAMSEYDKVLEDMYGLFANATNPDDVEKAIRNYYEETITGILNDNTVAGGDRMYVKQFTEELTKRMMKSDGTNEDELINFLAMELEDDGFEYTPIQDSRISNPVVMKNQIIDYMKYKGPVSVGTNFLNKLGFLKDAKNQSQAAQSKIEYTQALSDLSSPMEKAYKAIGSDDKTATDECYNFYAYKFNGSGYADEPTVAAIKDNMVSNLGKMIDVLVLEQNLLKIKKDLFGDTALNLDTLDISAYTGTESGKLNFGELTTHSTITKQVNKLTDAKDKLDLLSVKINEHITDTDKVNQLTLTPFEQTYGEITYEFNDNGDLGIKSLIMNTTGARSDHKATLGNLQKWDTALSVGAVYGDPGYIAALSSYWENQVDFLGGISDGYAEYKAYTDYIQALNTAYNKAYDEYTAAFAKYQPDDDITQNTDYQTFTKIKNMLNELASKWKTEQTYLLYESVLRKAQDTALYYLAKKKYAEEGLKDFQAYYGVVSKLEDYSNQALEALGTVLSELSEAETAATTWKSNIRNVEDQTAKSQMQSDADTLTKSVKREDIEKLQAVVETIHTRFDTLKKQLEDVKLLDTPLYNQTQDLPCNLTFIGKQELAPFATTTTSAVDVLNHYVCKQTGFSMNGWIDQSGKLSDAAREAAKIIHGEAEDEVFYTVLKNSYEAKNNKPQKDEKSEDQLANVNEISKVDGNGMPTSTPTGGEQPAEAAKPETGTAGDADTVGNALKDITEETSSTSDGLGQAGGVSIPSGNEDQGKMKEEAGKGKESLAGANKLLESLAKIGTSFRDDVYLEEYFTEMFTCQTDKLKKNGELKLLNGYTNSVAVDEERILNSNNPWYGQEIEFILWGDPNLQNNLAKTETTIFLLRFALNAIYAFTAADIQQMANGMASLLVGWCPVLIPVVQVCIVLGVALAESGLDLMELKNGKDVPIIKDKSTFACSPSGLANKVTDEVVGKAVEYANNKVDEALDDIADTTKKTIGDCMGDIKAAADTYAEQQISSIESGIKDQFVTPFINVIAPVMSRYNGDVKTAETLTSEAINQAWESIGNNINTSSKVGELARKLYDDQGEKKKNEIINVVSQKIQQANITASDIQDTLNKKVEGWFGSIRTELDDLTTELSDRIETELGKHVDESKENIKSYLDEQISDIGDDLAGTAKSLVKSSSGKIPDDVVDTNSKSVAAKITMNYKEYCKLFMFINMVGDETKCLQRAAALIQANVQYAAKDANSGFRMTQAYTMFHVGADVKLGTLFPWSPVTVTAGEGTGTSTDVDLTKLGGNYVTMQYSGINGY